MTSHKDVQNKAENTGRVKMKWWMKIVLSALLAIVLLLIAFVLAVNISHGRAGSVGIDELPRLPFSSDSYTMPLEKDVKGTEYKSGELLIIHKSTTIVKGDTVLIKNMFADRIDEAILRKYQIGIINEVGEGKATVSIPSFGSEYVEVDNDNILGKVSKAVGGAGIVYSRMTGVSGIMLFAVIPALFWILVFFIMHYLTLAAVGSTEHKGLNVVSAKTIRSTTMPLAKMYAPEQADQNVKLFVPKKVKSDKKKIIVHKDEELPAVDIKSIDERPRAVIEKIEKADNDAVIKDIKLSKERLNKMDDKNQTAAEKTDIEKNEVDLTSTQEFVIEMSADGQPIKPEVKEDNTDSAAKENKIDGTGDAEKDSSPVQEEKLVLKRVMSADQILKLYRSEGELNWARTNQRGSDMNNDVNNSEKVDASKHSVPKEETLETMARLYYDNEIDNYE